jgi:hypothetical protein
MGRFILLCAVVEGEWTVPERVDTQAMPEASK